MCNKDGWCATDFHYWHDACVDTVGPEIAALLRVMEMPVVHPTITQINRAFKRISLQAHPDKGGDQEKYFEIVRAHASLKDLYP